MMRWMLILLSMTVLADPVLLATMGNSKASISFDGKPVMVSVGETSHGVKLISVAADSAVVEVGGKRTTVAFGQGIFAPGAANAGASKITLANVGGHFFVNVGNGQAMLRGLVDTGASALTFSSVQAASLGVKIDKDTPRMMMSTADGVTTSWRVRLPEVRLGDVTLYNVDAAVLAGSFPSQPLVGMNVLSRFTMQREGDTMVLSRRY
jgi:aspartyl protease family protein